MKIFFTRRRLSVHGWTSSEYRNDTSENGSHCKIGSKPWISNSMFQILIKIKKPNMLSERPARYLDVSSYDTIMATSFGCPVIMQYLCEKNIKLKLSLFSSHQVDSRVTNISKSNSRDNGKCWETSMTRGRNYYPNTVKMMTRLARDLSMVNHCKKNWCDFFPINGVGHKFGGWSIDFISSLIQHGTPPVVSPKSRCLDG